MCSFSVSKNLVQQPQSFVRLVNESMLTDGYFSSFSFLMFRAKPDCNGGEKSLTRTNSEAVDWRKIGSGVRIFERRGEKDEVG